MRGGPRRIKYEARNTLEAKAQGGKDSKDLGGYVDD